MTRVMTFLAAAAVLPAAAGPAAAAFVVWDYGPTTGLAAPPEGSRSVFVNFSSNQNFLDTVSFAADTQITGYNLFTSSSRLPPGGSLYRVRFLADAGGVPGAVVTEFDVPARSIEFVGNFVTTAGAAADVFRVNLEFAPVTLAAGTTYWVGASGLNFDIGTYGVVGPGDGRSGLFFGPEFRFTTTTTGDLMFQLLSDAAPVPGPGGAVLLASGLAFGCLLRARRTLAGAGAGV